MIAAMTEQEGSHRAHGRTQGPAVPPAVEPLVAVLRQLETLVNSLTDEQYARKPVGVVPSSVGGHVRHNLDHIDALLRGLHDGTIDYDQRQRGTEVEHCREAALAALRRQQGELLTYPWCRGGRRLRLAVLLSPAGPPVTVTTTLDRELAFVLSHTIHHNSLIAVMVKLLGVPVPEEFGYAPATLAHRRGKSCVH